jgi:hypothetical protein
LWSFKPDFFNKSRASIAFVPSSLTTRGTSKFAFSAAPIIPLAIVAQLTIPPITIIE